MICWLERRNQLADALWVCRVLGWDQLPTLKIEKYNSRKKLLNNKKFWLEEVAL